MTGPATLRTALPGDHEAMRTLLEASGLDPEGLDNPASLFFVAMDHGRLAGTIGLERYGRAGLLRSAAVLPELRGKRIGEALVGALLDLARREGISEMFLLTTTAAAYFQRLGFAVIERAAVDPDVLRSAQFRGGCPSTAVCMRLHLA